jgi:hypothetical protein
VLQGGTVAYGPMFTDEARFGRMNRPRPCWAFWAPDLRSPSSSFATTSTYTEQVCPEGWNVHLSDHEAIEYECFQIFLNAPESLRNPKPASQLSLHLAPNPASRPCRPRWRSPCGRAGRTPRCRRGPAAHRTQRVLLPARRLEALSSRSRRHSRSSVQIGGSRYNP